MYSRDLIAAVKRYCSLNSVSSRHVGIIFGVNKDTVIRWLSDIQPSKHVREKVHVRIASSVRQILLTNPFFRLLDVQHALANLSIDASITSILDLYSTYGCRISVLNVTMVRLQRDLIRFTNKSSRRTNAIAIDETCFTSTILSVRVGVTRIHVWRP
jgi:hypothetical protein